MDRCSDGRKKRRSEGDNGKRSMEELLKREKEVIKGSQEKPEVEDER